MDGSFEQSVGHTMMKFLQLFCCVAGCAMQIPLQFRGVNPSATTPPEACVVYIYEIVYGFCSCFFSRVEISFSAIATAVRTVVSTL